MRRLRDRMETCSEQLRFEEAAKLVEPGKPATHGPANLAPVRGTSTGHVVANQPATAN